MDGGIAVVAVVGGVPVAVCIAGRWIRDPGIGAGIQLGPNAFHAFDALGVGDKARSRAVFTDHMVMHDALDEYQVGKIPTGEAFRERFGNPYAVIHRVDVHLSLLEGAQETGQVDVLTHTRIERVEQSADTVTAFDQHGNAYHGQGLIGADGVKSAVREQYVGDPPRVTGHVVYRSVVDRKDFPVLSLETGLNRNTPFRLQTLPREIGFLFSTGGIDIACSQYY